MSFIMFIFAFNKVLANMSIVGFREDIIHADSCLYKNQIDYVDKLITIYSVIKMDKDCQLRQFEKDVCITRKKRW